MALWMYLLLFVLFAITDHQEQEAVEQAFHYFQEAKWIAHQDNGRLWDQFLYGPILFANPQNRRVYANRPDSAGYLKKSVPFTRQPSPSH